ncbi:glycosyl transferase [Candidatus Methylomirabilis lanthanidiphila]|uniref:Glycosyl transferase n=1 Tax=Candidatus Methylomirabilis lanthanidiphila TaxID=2211376 RepID=A0A564ZIM7_9BACT|nr:glycosyltransferase [Candidatus Methylomirabilis lanthanidiphila]VUZ84492.1 glycosyl transferase [Candidatus Methylomirabilis lanthanidiphila]
MDVSVIIPCHNIGEFLDECIESVVAQDIADMEIIVVDDGSTDPYTLEVLSRLPETYRGISVVRVAHRNVGLARNAGFARSSGDFILFVDADDVLGERFLTTTLDGLRRRQDCGVAFTDVKLFGQVSGMWYTGPFLFAGELYFDNYLQYCSLIRRRVIEVYGGFDAMPGHADWDFWIKLYKNGVRFLKVHDVYAWYRKRENSMLARIRSQRPHLINRLILNHKEVYSRLFLWTISDREVCRVQGLLQAATEHPHDAATVDLLRHTRPYRQFTSYRAVVRTYQKAWGFVMRGKS